MIYFRTGDFADFPSYVSYEKYIKSCFGAPTFARQSRVT